MEGQGVMVPVNVLDFTGPLLVSTSLKVGRANAQGRRGEKGDQALCAIGKEKKKQDQKVKFRKGRDPKERR